MEKEINAIATISRYQELIVAERDAQLMKAYLKQKRANYQAISFDEVKMLNDMFCKDVCEETE